MKLFIKLERITIRSDRIISKFRHYVFIKLNDVKHYISRQF